MAKGGGGWGWGLLASAAFKAKFNRCDSQCQSFLVCWGRVVVVAEVEGAALLSKMTETNAKVEEALTALTAVEAEFEEASKASESLKQQEVELNNQLDDVNLSIRSRKARVG